MRIFLLLLVGLFGLLWGGVCAKAQADAGIPRLDRLATDFQISAWDYAFWHREAGRDTFIVCDQMQSRQFRAGSLGKIVVAMGILRLAEQGRLLLSDPVARHLPGLEIENAWQATDPLRVEHLLEHTAGLDDMHFSEYYLGGSGRISLADALERNPACRRLRWRPGTRSAYSNVGYAIAGRLIEEIVGVEADVWLRENVLLPMGMRHSYFERGDAQNASIVQGSKGKQAVDHHPYLYYPAVGWVTTAQDMGRLLAFLLGEGQFAGDTILQPTSVARMMRSETTLASKRGWNDGDYGLGLRVWSDGKTKRMGATGFVDGYLAQMEIYPDQAAAWVLLGTDAVNQAAYLAEMRRVFGLQVGASSGALRLPEKAAMPVAGEYSFASSRNALMDFKDNLFSRLTVLESPSSKEGEWTGHFPGQPPFAMAYQASDSKNAFNSEARYNAFAGKTAEGKGFLVIEGKYFEEDHSRWPSRLRGLFGAFEWVAVVLTFLVPA
ncbi:MAG TPA: serine hydrolase domain-containing protein, partial [Bacteroidia bacterium]|nr:serine hydrolase domain-containing protein [Bacteroidia bacterium]